MAIMSIGYARVSTADQNLDMQLDALKAAGCQRIYQEAASGKAGSKRPELQNMLRFIAKGDTLVVWKLDRLGRSMLELMTTLASFERQGIHFKSLTEDFDSATAHGRFFIQMQASMAEYFLELNRERTVEGLRSAIARGSKPGRRPKLSEADQGRARALLQAGDLTVDKIAKEMGVGRDTFYRYFPKARTANSTGGVRQVSVFTTAEGAVSPAD